MTRRFSFGAMLAATAVAYALGVVTPSIVNSLQNGSPKEVEEDKAEKLIEMIGYEPRDWIGSDQDDDFEDFLEWDQAEEFTRLLNGDFDYDHIPSYMEYFEADPDLTMIKVARPLFDVESYGGYSRIATATRLATLENREEWARLFVENEITLWGDALTRFTAQEGSLELLRELGAKFESGDVNEYIGLLREGVSVQDIARAPSYALDTMLSKANDSSFPRDLLGHIVGDEYERGSRREARENYSKNAAATLAQPGVGDDGLREYIIDKVKSREHCTRKGTDYDEDIEQINDVDDINILHLVRGYVDFFGDSGNRSTIGVIIERDFQDSQREGGGVVVCEEGEYSFIPIAGEDTDPKVDDLEKNGEYRPPEWTEMLGKVGRFHLHATQEDDTRYCGPSGSARYRTRGDLSNVRVAENRFAVDCVITSLGEGKFNADVYFLSKDGTVKVLDLGNYDTN